MATNNLTALNVIIVRAVKKRPVIYHRLLRKAVDFQEQVENAFESIRAELCDEEYEIPCKAIQKIWNDCVTIFKQFRMKNIKPKDEETLKLIEELEFLDIHVTTRDPITTDILKKTKDDENAPATKKTKKNKSKLSDYEKKLAENIKTKQRLDTEFNMTKKMLERATQSMSENQDQNCYTKEIYNALQKIPQKSIETCFDELLEEIDVINAEIVSSK